MDRTAASVAVRRRYELVASRKSYLDGSHGNITHDGREPRIDSARTARAIEKHLHMHAHVHVHAAHAVEESSYAVRTCFTASPAFSAMPLCMRVLHASDGARTTDPASSPSAPASTNAKQRGGQARRRVDAHAHAHAHAHAAV